ncbi:MAG: ABC transporter ATP-binding protein [Dehalococcoidia bacterium]|jgi:putative ABC transport system ATP-binding protein|nr:ABC transporter ATP-binding protein [Dehalococcoidia bacterium]
MTTPVIELQDLRREFRMGDENVNALDGASLTVEEGEMVAIVGRSGSGKSTLMNILGCLDTPSGGRYLLNGEDITELSDDRLSEIRGRYLGFVFQNYNLLPRVSALGNVELALHYRPRRGNKRALAMEALDRVGLAHRSAHRPPELSGGEQQRVGIARALVSDPRLVLADEPTGNLDSRSSDLIMATIQSLNRDDGLTIVVVTHDDEVAGVANRIISLADGRVVEDRIIEPRIVVSPIGPSGPEPVAPSATPTPDMAPGVTAPDPQTL